MKSNGFREQYRSSALHQSPQAVLLIAQSYASRVDRIVWMVLLKHAQACLQLHAVPF